MEDSADKTALHHASTGDCARSLIAGGADVDALDAEGFTPLMVGIDQSNVSVVRALLEGGARMDTPLHYPAGQYFMSEVVFGNANGVDTELVKALVDDLDQALIEAIGEVEGVDWIATLLRAGASANARRGEDETTPLHEVAKSFEVNWRPGSDPYGAAVMASLIRAGAVLDARDLAGATPLHRAVSATREPACVIALLEAGADASLRDGAGNTPWDRLQSNRRLKGKLQGSSALRQLQDADSRTSKQS